MHKNRNINKFFVEHQGDLKLENENAFTLLSLSTKTNISGLRIFFLLLICYLPT